tara:strand:+ start:2646 stop:3608 length:963 start_codon:yes stop_codon:yes gene_type:complete
MYKDYKKSKYKENFFTEKCDTICKSKTQRENEKKEKEKKRRKREKCEKVCNPKREDSQVDTIGNDLGPEPEPVDVIDSVNEKDTSKGVCASHDECEKNEFCCPVVKKCLKYCGNIIDKKANTFPCNPHTDMPYESISGKDLVPGVDFNKDQNDEYGKAVNNGEPYYPFNGSIQFKRQKLLGTRVPSSAILIENSKEAVINTNKFKIKYTCPTLRFAVKAGEKMLNTSGTGQMEPNSVAVIDRGGSNNEVVHIYEVGENYVSLLSPLKKDHACGETFTQERDVKLNCVSPNRKCGSQEQVHSLGDLMAGRREIYLGAKKNN